MKNMMFILAEKETRLAQMDAEWLRHYIARGHSVYMTAEAAEAGRQAGDAYDEPGRTRVVGFEVKAFLPKKYKKKEK